MAAGFSIATPEHRDAARPSPRRGPLPRKIAQCHDQAFCRMRVPLLDQAAKSRRPFGNSGKALHIESTTPRAQVCRNASVNSSCLPSKPQCPSAIFCESTYTLTLIIGTPPSSVANVKPEHDPRSAEQMGAAVADRRASANGVGGGWFWEIPVYLRLKISEMRSNSGVQRSIGN